tara:strand:- start:73 stop:603 length:531 start_codon:yes stop_codon:yes gene_type:complete
MHIIVLGGCNDHNGELTNDTKRRCEKCKEILNNYSILNTICLHFSGGNNPKFNKLNGGISHAELCKKYFESICSLEVCKTIHPHNDSTVDEAIYFAELFKNKNEQIIIITNIWHLERVKYLFEKTFPYHNISNFMFIKSKSNISFLQEEQLKINMMKNNPYGKWVDWLNTNKLSSN